MSRKLGFQIAAVLFGVQGLGFVLAATFFGASVGVYVPVGVANFFAGSIFLQMSFRGESGGDGGRDSQDPPPES